jgi:hypothetical protein
MPRLTYLSEEEYANGILQEAKRIERIEQARKLPPTQKQIKSVLRFLKQFCIQIKPNKVPKFNTVAELELWKKKMIKTRGNGYV